MSAYSKNFVNLVRTNDSSDYATSVVSTSVKYYCKCIIVAKLCSKRRDSDHIKNLGRYLCMCSVSHFTFLYLQVHRGSFSSFNHARMFSDFSIRLRLPTVSIPQKTISSPNENACDAVAQIKS